MTPPLVVPPVGGYGANTGIHAAHNLAWKLAQVHRGEAGPAILDTYRDRAAASRRVRAGSGYCCNAPYAWD